MNFIKNLLLFVVILATLGLGALFAVQNTASVPLDLLVLQLPERSVALWVLLAFAVGGVLGMLTSLGVVLRLRAALLRVNRQLARQANAAATVSAGKEAPEQAAEAAAASAESDRES